MDRWRNKVALVTGASSGIGAALALMLVDSGVKVVACARRVDKIRKLAERTNGVIVPIKVFLMTLFTNKALNSLSSVTCVNDPKLSL